MPGTASVHSKGFANIIGPVCFPVFRHIFPPQSLPPTVKCSQPFPPALCMVISSLLLYYLCRKTFVNMSKWDSPDPPLFSGATLYFLHRTCDNWQIFPFFGYPLISWLSLPQDFNCYKDLDHIYVVYPWIPSTQNIALTQESSIKLLSILFILLMGFKCILTLSIGIDRCLTT